MTAASVIPEVLTAVYGTLTAAVDKDTAAVFDGPPKANFSGDAVFVGWSPLDASGADSSQEIANTAVDRNEDFDITLYVTTYSGTYGFAALRLRANSLAGVVATAAKNDPTLATLVVGNARAGWLSIARTRWAQQAVENGWEVGVELHLQGRARI